MSYKSWLISQPVSLEELDSLIDHYLITEGVSADSDGLRPARNKPGNVLADDWLAEDGASQDVSDGSVGALPHLLQLEL